MADVINALVTQAPNSVALIIVIVLFLKAIDTRESRYADLMFQRDKEYLKALKEITDKVDNLHTAFDRHDQRNKKP
jgi:hypothetical protein